MSRAELKSVFDAAFWFLDTALNDNEYLQPQKLQRLLFLSQAYYAVVYEGQALFPAVFVAEEMGPIEPNVYAAFSKGRPDIEVDLFLSAETEEFLASIWRRFGHHTADYLNRITNDTRAYEKARAGGRRSEIPLAMMQASFERGDTAPAAEQVVRPKTHMTQHGKLVRAKSWTPKKNIGAGDARIIARPAGRRRGGAADEDAQEQMAQAAQPLDWTAQVKQVPRETVAAPSRARLEEEKKARLRRFEADGLPPAPPKRRGE